MRKHVALIAFMLLPFLLTAQGSNPPSATATPADGVRKDAAVWNNITFLNAANFDFSDNISGSYLGKINIFAPDIRNSPFGFNAGIVRIKFNIKDSSNSTYIIENRLINPLDSIKQGNKYLRQFNQYTTSRSNTVWSLYVQPMLRLYSFPTMKKGKFNINSIAPDGIFLHLHGELFVSKVNVTTTITHLQQDTALIDTTTRLAYKVYERNPLIFDHSYLSGYFGGGITISVDPFQNGNSRFFFQATFGVTNNYPNWTSEDIASTVVNVIPTRGGTTPGGPRGGTPSNIVTTIKSGGFYLIRSEFAQLLSNNSQLVLGTDIRGLLPKYSPLWATYIGLNVNLDALAKVISDRKSDSDNSSKSTTATPTSSSNLNH